MFRTRRDVEEHVTNILSKIDNENEKLLKGYTFARLFFQVKDYESAKKYLTGYLSLRQQYAPAHKLMAQIYEATNNLENALQSYKRSLDIDSNQKDIILKICELYCQLPVDPETARYWAERAEQLFPYHDTVFKLREYLVSAEGEPDHQELENLIASDLAAQPKNVDRRIKLLRLYLDTERVKEAYDHATMIESKRLFPYSIDWYYLLCDIFEAYQEEDGKELNCQFYISYLTALDHLIFLTLAEPHVFTLETRKKACSVNDASSILLTFDQVLKKAVQMNNKEGAWTYFMHHMKGQLYFHMASVLMKRIKMDQGNPKEAFRFSSGLALVCYTFKPVNLLHEVWFSQMEENQKVFTSFFQQGCLRISFIGHVLLSLCKDDKSSWLQKIKTEVCIPQVKERIYNRIFSSVFQKEKLQSSYFVSDTTFEQTSLEFPSDLALKEYDKYAYKLCPDSLHHLVWLELHRENAKISSYDFISEIFKNLQYSNKNLSKGSCESLCVLDLEAYLCAAIYQSKLMIEIKSNINSRNDSVLSYPPDLIDALCTAVQASWWKAAYGLYTASIKQKLGEHRHNLQHGLEVIRGVGCHGMEVQLVIHLARTFASKADTLDKVSENKTDKNKNKLSSENVIALYFRATHYWNIALGMLDKLTSGKSLNLPKNSMFVHSKKTLSKNDIKTYKEEGELFLAVRLMESDKLNEAAERLSKLSSPYGSYYLALTLKKLASQEQKFSSTRSALLNKAKTSLHETLDRVKDDNTHPLNKEIFIELEDVENDLAFELSVTGENSCDDPDEVDAYDESSFQSFSCNKSTTHSTPRPSSKFMSSKHSMKSINQFSPTKHYEPSPERLDAQIRALALNQDTLVKAFLQQQQTLLETNNSIVDALKQNKDVLEQLKKQLEDLSLREMKPQQKTVPKKSMYKTNLDRGNEEEEYYDPNGILDYYEDGGGGDDYRHPGYAFDHSSRLAHESTRGASAPLNYVVPPTLPPPGPPPPLNHYNYQYPHAMLPTPPAAVAERSPYYHAAGQGLPFNEGQQLPQFHFHVASAIGKPPPPLSTSLPQVVPGLPPPSVSVPPLSVPQVASGLPPPSISVPPMSAAMPPPAAVSLSVSNPWSKPTSVPHAFQIPLPTSSVIAPVIVPAVTQVTSTAIFPTVNTSHSQLKDLLQTPPVTRTITFGQPVNTTPSTTTSATSPSIFSGINKTPEAPKERIHYDSETATSPDIDGHDIEREVMGDFKPLIPLPAEIVVETGEENEIVLFEDRAKLYRFVDQEWKERGIGVIKILHHEASGRVRLLMRRDQVLKVCANHYITPHMEIYPLKNSDKAWTWVAQDFADEELRPEHFCIRFKTPEIANIYKIAFEKAVNVSKETEGKKITSPKGSTAITSPMSSKPFGSKFLPKQGSWTCPTCYVSNPGDIFLCNACETKKPGSQILSTTSPTSLPTPVTSDFGLKFLPKPGSWTCPTCYVNNLSDKLACSACETKKPGAQISITSSVTSVVANTLSPISEFGAQFLPKAGSWTCTACYVNNSSDKIICAACETKKPGIPSSTAVPTSSVVSSTITSEFSSKPFLNSATSNSFAFGGQTNVFTSVSSTSNNTSKSVFGGFTFSSNPVIQEAEIPEMKDREILVVSTKSKNGPQVTKVNAPKTSPFSGFSFKAPSVTTVAPSIQPPSVTNSTTFSGFAFKSSVVSSTTSSVPSPNVTANTSNISLSSIQNLVQNVSPAFVFSKSSSEKGICTTTETKSTTSDSVESGSVFSNFTPDSVKSAGEFVFGMKPSTQPTTFTFGLSTLSSKSNETIGFKPTFSTTSNSPAVFGGAVQKAESAQNITSGSTQKIDSSELSSIFGGTSRIDSPQNSSVFGGIAQASESKLPVSSFFGSASDKTESSTSVFCKSSSFEAAQEKTLFGGLNEKLESSKQIPFGTVLKSETVTNSHSSSIFNFGGADESKTEAGPIEFRFGSPQKYEFNFSGVRPKSPTKTPKSPATPSDVEDDEENESFDADNIYFQPVIPLPPKVDVKTGEENEKTLFCKRAKLFRFCSGEWKERGIGEIKILHDAVGRKVRLLMRRDQVLKVCLNHYLTKDIKFEKRGDKTLSWAATDFSENEPCPELFALRLKTAEFADEFLAAVNNALNCAEEQSSNPDVEKAAAAFSFKDDNAQKSESLFAPGSLTARFGSSTASSLGSTQSPLPSFGDFSFKDSTTSTFFKFGSTTDDQKSLDNKEFAFSKGFEEKNIDDNDVQIVYEAIPSPEDVANAEKLQLPSTFFLYKNKIPCPGCIGCEDFVSPPKGTSIKVVENDAKNTSDSDVSTQVTTQEESESTMFNTSSSLSFADLASKTGFGEMTSPNQKKIFEGAGTPLFANLNCSAEGDGEEDTVAQGPDIHFEPVIPLPELVTITTGEEEETPIFVNRAKLFRFDPIKKEWKERGVGDFKILKHNEKLRFRIILRREQVHKIACNHCIAPNMDLSPLTTSNTALCWNAVDYSEGQPEASQFAVRFKTKEMLQQFKEKFDECVNILKEDSMKPIVQTAPQIVEKIESSQQETPTPENVADTSNEHESSGSETNDDDEESEDDGALFEKRVSFEISDGNDNEFRTVGMGILRIAYDDDVYGYHVYMNSDNGQILCEHIIAIQTALRTEKKKASWSAIDLTLDPPRRRRFRATFSSIDALKEFSSVFEEGKEAAVHSEIVEKIDCFNSSGHQT